MISAVARTGPQAMSALRSLTEEEQTSRGQPNSVEIEIRHRPDVIQRFYRVVTLGCILITLPNSRRRTDMINAEQCKAHVSECLRLRNAPNVSDRRVRVLMSMLETAIVLANQIQRYDGVLLEEEGSNEPSKLAAVSFESRALSA